MSSYCRLVTLVALFACGGATAQTAPGTAAGPGAATPLSPEILKLERMLNRQSPAAGSEGASAAGPAPSSPAGPRRKPGETVEAPSNAAPAAGAGTTGGGGGGGGLTFSVTPAESLRKSDGPLILPTTGGNWEYVDGLHSGRMAASGWSMLGMSGLSWPDGRQGILTYWNDAADKRSGFYVRCLAYFDAGMSARGEKCEAAVASETEDGAE